MGWGRDLGDANYKFINYKNKSYVENLPYSDAVKAYKAGQIELDKALETLLDKLDEAGFPKPDLITLQNLVDMEKSDLYDVLEYVFNGNYKAMTREARAKAAEATIFALLNDNQKEFISFVLSNYIASGVEELDQEKLPILLTNKYQSLEDAKEILGDVDNISRLFINFQQYLYKQKVV